MPDKRDLRFYPLVIEAKLPVKVDLAPKCSPVEDQGQIGSCTAQSVAGLLEFNQKKKMEHSRFFIYWNERVMEGTTDEDAGATLRSGMKVIHQLGSCDEKLWEHKEDNLFTAPPKKCFTAAKKNKIKQYTRVGGHINSMKTILASGVPFVFGFAVYSSFMTAKVAKSGVMPMPKSHDSMLGGHAVMAVGYDDKKKMVKIRNSWGVGWGQKGYFYMPYEFIDDSDFCDDFWMIG